MLILEFRRRFGGRTFAIQRLADARYAVAQILGHERISTQPAPTVGQIDWFDLDTGQLIARHTRTIPMIGENE